MTQINKTTTVKKIKMAIAGMKDDDEVKFIGTYKDHDGFLNETEVYVRKIVKGDLEPIQDKYRCYVYPVEMNL